MFCECSTSKHRELYRGGPYTDGRGDTLREGERKGKGIAKKQGRRGQEMEKSRKRKKRKKVE